MAENPKVATDHVVFGGAPRVGLRNVGSYQVSGMPWVTGSWDLDNGKVHMIEFPYVTKTITVANVSAADRPILVHFQSGSAAAVTVPGPTGHQDIAATADVIAGFHYMPLVQFATTGLMSVKCTKLYISNLTGDTSNLRYMVYAELTNIPTQRMPHLTGSGITE